MVNKCYDYLDNCMSNDYVPIFLCLLIIVWKGCPALKY